MQAISGKKLMMTRIFDEDGKQVPVTLVMLEDNIVTQIKTPEKDGYPAIQVAVGTRRRLNRPQKGHLGKLEIKPAKLYEIKTNNEYKVGDQISSEIFKPGEKVCVTSISKGKGFAGTVKRHKFHLGPKTHGSHNYRQPGSIGSMFPQRVVKGRRMAGRLGAIKTTIKNIAVVKVDPEKKLVYLKGALPGPKNTSVLLWRKQ